jgi:hypothetical protein
VTTAEQHRLNAERLLLAARRSLRHGFEYQAETYFRRAEREKALAEAKTEVKK